MKYIIISITFLILILFTYSKADSDNGQNKQTNINNFVVGESDVKKAPCKSNKKLVLDLEMIKIFIKDKSDSGNQKLDTNINGVNLTNESPLMIKAFKQLTSAVNFMGNELKNQKNIQILFSINPECTKVLCAVDKIWGPEGLKILYLLTRYGFNGSEFSYEKTARFESDELDDVLMSLADLPSFFVPLGRENQRLSHYTRNLINTSTLANATITLYDDWTKEPSFMRQYALFHEASHSIATRLDHLDNNPEWLTLSGWEQKGYDNWSSKKNACQVSLYGAINPREDFAESVAYFRYNGNEFKMRCPIKFQFIKERVFNNLEYLDDSNCSR